LRQADAGWLWSAFFGGVVFNLSNILLVAAIDIAGMAVAFPIGVGLALALGVITTYLARPEGNGLALAAGVTAIVVAVVLDALAYRKLATHRRRTPTKGIALSIAAGVLMGFFYSFVARAIAETAPVSGGGGLEAGKLTPYTALVLFSVGLVASNFVWNTAMMLRPFSGSPVSFRDYFKGTLRLHLIGILGGAIWNLGLGLSLVANHAAGPALSYGLGQGATMIGALWGVFVWREFRDGPRGTRGLLTAMFCFYLLGLGILVASKL
jgi:glucose uptake protein